MDNIDKADVLLYKGTLFKVFEKTSWRLGIWHKANISQFYQSCVLDAKRPNPSLAQVLTEARPVTVDVMPNSVEIADDSGVSSGKRIYRFPRHSLKRLGFEDFNGRKLLIAVFEEQDWLGLRVKLACWVILKDDAKEDVGHPPPTHHSPTVERKSCDQENGPPSNDPPPRNRDDDARSNATPPPRLSPYSKRPEVGHTEEFYPVSTLSTTDSSLPSPITDSKMPSPITDRGLPSPPITKVRPTYRPLLSPISPVDGGFTYLRTNHHEETVEEVPSADGTLLETAKGFPNAARKSERSFQRENSFVQRRASRMDESRWQSTSHHCRTGLSSLSEDSDSFHHADESNSLRISQISLSPQDGRVLDRERLSNEDPAPCQESGMPSDSLRRVCFDSPVQTVIPDQGRSGYEESLGLSDSEYSEDSTFVAT